MRLETATAGARCLLAGWCFVFRLLSASHATAILFLWGAWQEGRTIIANR